MCFACAMRGRRALLLGFMAVAITLSSLWPKLGHAAGQRPLASPVVSVLAARATVANIPRVVSGLGTVTALNTVLIRPEVSGVLEHISFKEGQMVPSGALLAQIDPRTYQAALREAEAKEAEDEARLTNARLDLARYANLAKSDFASRQQVATQEAQVATLVATLKADAAAVDVAKLNLSFTRITAPMAGRMGFLRIDPGNLVQGGQAAGIATLTQITPISVLFTLPQHDLQRVLNALHHGQLSVTALSGDGKSVLGKGKLLTIDNSIDTSTGTFTLKAIFPNVDYKLWPGEFVNADLRLGVLKNVIVVPSAAIQHGPNGLYVYRVGSHQRASRVPVEVAKIVDHEAVVSKGLNVGVEVITAGALRLDDGTRVRVVSGANPAA